MRISRLIGKYDIVMMNTMSHTQTLESHLYANFFITLSINTKKKTLLRCDLLATPPQ